MLTLITGGARSGKSRYAQSLCASARRVVYLATAQASDDEEMRQRIATHRASRPDFWITVEEPLLLAELVAQQPPETEFVLIDCLTVWLSNFSWRWRECGSAELEEAALSEISKLIEASKRVHVVAVSNEVGSGIVPETPVGRRFRDLQGLVNQRVASAADSVYLTVCGLPLLIKQPAGGA